MIYVMIVNASVMKDVEVNDAKKKETAERRIIINIVKETDSAISFQENRVKYSACVVLRRMVAVMAIMLKMDIVTMIRRIIPRNLPTIYWGRDIGLARTV